MLRTAVSISAAQRKVIEELTQKDILGFHLASNTDVFMMAIAMGLNDPQALKAKDPYIRTEYITKARDKSLFQTVALGIAENDAQIDQYADLESCLDLCEQCAESGFRVLSDEVSSAEWDKEILERRLLKKLDLLYTKNIENDI